MIIGGVPRSTHIDAAHENASAAPSTHHDRAVLRARPAQCRQRDAGAYCAQVPSAAHQASQRTVRQFDPWHATQRWNVDAWASWCKSSRRSWNGPFPLPVHQTSDAGAPVAKVSSPPRIPSNSLGRGSRSYAETANGWDHACACSIKKRVPQSNFFRVSASVNTDWCNDLQHHQSETCVNNLVFRAASRASG